MMHACMSRVQEMLLEKNEAGRASDGHYGRAHVHSKQLCVPLRIFLRVGSVSSLGISTSCVPLKDWFLALATNSSGLAERQILRPTTGWGIYKPCGTHFPGELSPAD